VKMNGQMFEIVVEYVCNISRSFLVWFTVSLSDCFVTFCHSSNTYMSVVFILRYSGMVWNVGCVAAVGRDR